MVTIRHQVDMSDAALDQRAQCAQETQCDSNSTDLVSEMHMGTFWSWAPVGSLGLVVMTHDFGWCLPSFRGNWGQRGLLSPWVWSKAVAASTISAKATFTLSDFPLCPDIPVRNGKNDTFLKEMFCFGVWKYWWISGQLEITQKIKSSGLLSCPQNVPVHQGPIVFVSVKIKVLWRHLDASTCPRFLRSLIIYVLQLTFLGLFDRDHKSRQREKMWAVDITRKPLEDRYFTCSIMRQPDAERA